MTIEEFLQLSQGEWLSQKTNHQVAFRRYESGKSTVKVDNLAADAPEIVAICQHHNVDPTTSLGGTKTLWTGYLAGDASERREETEIALVPNNGDPSNGKLFCKITLDRQASHRSGTYTLGADRG